MSISGISSVPLYAINNTQAVLGVGSIALPSLRYTNSPSSGLYRESPNLCIAVNGVKCAEFNGGVQTFTAEVKTGMVRADNGNIALIESGNVVSSVFNGNLNATQTTMANMKFTKTPTTGYVLTAQDGTGNVQWSAPSTLQNLTLGGPVRSTSFVATSGVGSITSCSYISHEVRDILAGSRVVDIMGRFTFNGTVAEGSSGYVEIDINSIISGFAVEHVEGVVIRNPGLAGTYALSIHEANTRIRITLTNTTAAPWLTSTTFAFNIKAINS